MVVSRAHPPPRCDYFSRKGKKDSVLTILATLLSTPFSTRHPGNAASNDRGDAIKNGSRGGEKKREKERGDRFSACSRRAMIARRKKNHPANATVHRDVTRSPSVWRRWENRRQVDTIHPTRGMLDSKKEYSIVPRTFSGSRKRICAVYWKKRECSFRKFEYGPCSFRFCKQKISAPFNPSFINTKVRGEKFEEIFGNGVPSREGEITISSQSGRESRAR